MSKAVISVYPVGSALNRELIEPVVAEFGEGNATAVGEPFGNLSWEEVESQFGKSLREGLEMVGADP